jgi:N-acetylmuramoyl-L-alanine amidase
MAKKVFIGVGHGGSDPGAVANGFKEKDLNLVIALACQDELARHGVLVKMSRTKDDNESLTEKINECNSYAPDLALDIHNNAGGGDGAEVYHHYKGGTGKTLANNILAEVVAIGQNSRGAKIKTNSSGKDYFGFIRDTAAPAVIVECAFLDTKDVQIIDTNAEQRAMGVAIAKGILKTLGVAYIPEEPKPVQTTPGTLYRVQVGAYGVRANAEAMQKKLAAAGFDAIIVKG